MQKHYIINGNKIAEEDLQYFNETPPSGFSPEKNRATIAKTIAKYKAYLAQKQKTYDQELSVRTNALMDYFKYLDKKPGTDPEKYFGRRILAQLRGRRIKSTIFKAANGQRAARLDYLDHIITD